MSNLNFADVLRASGNLTISGAISCRLTVKSAFLRVVYFEPVDSYTPEGSKSARQWCWLESAK